MDSVAGSLSIWSRLPMYLAQASFISGTGSPSKWSDFS